MNLNEFAFTAKNRRNKKAFRITHIQNGVSANPKKPSTAATSSKSSNVDHFHYEATGSKSHTLTSDATITTVEEAGVIIAISEGRGEASCEVGISAINTQAPELFMFQISDTSSYTKVLNKVYFLNPVEIVVPTTMSESRLVTFLKRVFPSVKITGIDRAAFRKENGVQFVKDVCAKAYNSVLLFLQHKYYTFTAASALRIYLEMYKRQFYAKDTLRVTYNESDYNTMIDVFVADRLELVACALDNGIESPHKKQSSLRGILNHCVTKLGARMLRSTILQPPNQLQEIEERLDCVEELYKCPEALMSIRDQLTRLANFGRVLSISTILKATAQYCDERHLNYVLLLNSFFDDIEPMRELLATRKCKFFHKLHDALSRKELQELRAAFKLVISENAHPAHGEQARIERCFAIKPGYNDVLDFLRKRFSDRKEEMRNHVVEAARELGYDLQLAHNQKKDFHMVVQLGAKQTKKFNKSSLPDNYCQVDVMATMVTFKSIKLITLSNLLEDTTVEIIRISNLFLHDLLLHVQRHISVFYDLCEQVAKLDLIQSLAQATGSGLGYVRPTFGNHTSVIDGRHPLLDFILENPPIPNNIIATPENRLHLITGPNGSGKSIYIRQIVLLQIMAQIGCFVPAKSATFRICDRILARIYFDDNLECGESTFTLEMKEIVYFLNVITDRTLIIIDELCRATAEKEGTALAMAICEHLMKTPAFIYFTTHYTYIMKLQQMYSHIRCWQLETEEICQEGHKPKLLYRFKVIPGIVTLKAYGLALTRSLWPDTITEDCERIMGNLKDEATVSSIDKKMALKINFESTLVELKRQGKCTRQNVYVRWLQYKEDMALLGIEISSPESDSDSDDDSANVPSTQIGNMDMELTQTDRHTEILTHGSCETKSIPKRLSDVPGTNLVNHSSNTSELSEESYVMQNRRHSGSPCIVNATAETSSMVNYVLPRKNINILQNVVVKPGNPVSPPTTKTSIAPAFKTGNTSFNRHYSDIAREDRQLLQEPDDYCFTPIQNVPDFFAGNLKFSDSKSSAFHPVNIRSTQERHIGGTEAFEMFTQHIKSLKGLDPPLTNTSNDGGAQFGDGFIITENNADDVQQMEEDLSFIFDDKDNEDNENNAANYEENYFDFNDRPSTSTSGPTRNILYACNKNEDFQDFCAPQPGPSTDNSISSLNSFNFQNGLGYEKTSTPVPTHPLPVQPEELTTIADRLNHAQQCLSNTPQPTYYRPASTLEKGSSFDAMPTYLPKNPISYSSTTGTRPKTSDSEFTKPSGAIRKRRLMDSQQLNQTNEEFAFDRKADDQTSFHIEEIPEPDDGIIGSDNQEFVPCLEELPRAKPLPNATKYKPLNKLTKREVNAFYDQKREELLKSNDPKDIERYYHELSHRPSMRQMRQSEILVTARNTAAGGRVFDVPRTRKKPEVVPVRRYGSFGVPFDQTMFSDANSRVFESFLEYERKSNGQATLSFEEFKRQFNNS